MSQEAKSRNIKLEDDDPVMCTLFMEVMYCESISSRLVTLADLAGIYGLADKYDAPDVRRITLHSTSIRMNRETAKTTCDGIRIAWRVTSSAGSTLTTCLGRLKICTNKPSSTFALRSLPSQGIWLQRLAHVSGTGKVTWLSPRISSGPRVWLRMTKIITIKVETIRISPQGGLTEMQEAELSCLSLLELVGFLRLSC